MSMVLFQNERLSAQKEGGADAAISTYFHDPRGQILNHWLIYAHCSVSNAPGTRTAFDWELKKQGFATDRRHVAERNHYNYLVVVVFCRLEPRRITSHPHQPDALVYALCIILFYALYHSRWTYFGVPYLDLLLLGLASLGPRSGREGVARWNECSHPPPCPPIAPPFRACSRHCCVATFNLGGGRRVRSLWSKC